MKANATVASLLVFMFIVPVFAGGHWLPEE